MAINLTKTIPSSEIVRTGWVKFTFNIGNIDMRTAKKLALLEAEVRGQIKANGWTVQKNEKEICTAVVMTMHSPDLFKSFDPVSGNNIDTQKRCVDELNAILIEKVPFNKNTLLELTKVEKSLSAIQKKMIGSWISERLMPRKLESFKSQICHEDAPTASYVLDRLGITNDLCYGVGNVTGFSCDNPAAMHCFIQCKSGNIVETESKDHPFCRSLNSGKISRGEIVLVDNGKPGDIETYGGGRTSFGNMLGIVFSGFKSSHLYATRDNVLNEMRKTEPEFFEEMKQNRLKAGKIMQPTLVKYTSREIHDADKNHDGLLSKAEIDGLHLLKAHGNKTVIPSSLPRLPNAVAKN